MKALEEGICKIRYNYEENITWKKLKSYFRRRILLKICGFLNTCLVDFVGSLLTLSFK